MKTISAKVTDELYERAKQIAKDNSLSVSAMIKQAFTTASIKDISYEKKILHQLHRIGNNVNQLSRHCNTKKVLDRQILLSLLRIETDLKELL